MVTFLLLCIQTDWINNQCIAMPLVSVPGTDDKDDQMSMVATRMMMRSMKVVVVWGPMGSVASCGADVVGPVLQFYSGRAAVGR